MIIAHRGDRPTADATTTTAARRADPAHSALVGLASLGVLLQGMAIDGTRAAVVVHVPLTMLLLGLAVWLPTQARHS